MSSMRELVACILPFASNPILVYGHEIIVRPGLRLVFRAGYSGCINPVVSHIPQNI